MTEYEQYRTEEVDCLNCGHHWVAVYSEGTRLLECPTCKFTNQAPDTYPPPFHLVLSVIDDKFYVTPSRVVTRTQLMGYLQEATSMLGQSNAKYCHPNDCSTRVAVSVFPTEDST